MANLLELWICFSSSATLSTILLPSNCVGELKHLDHMPRPHSPEFEPLFPLFPDQINTLVVVGLESKRSPVCPCATWHSGSSKSKTSSVQLRLEREPKGPPVALTNSEDRFVHYVKKKRLALRRDFVSNLQRQRFPCYRHGSPAVESQPIHFGWIGL